MKIKLKGLLKFCYICVLRKEKKMDRLMKVVLKYEPEVLL